MAKAGDSVTVVTKKEKIDGVLMPSSSSDVFVKLPSGYNIGIDKKDVKKIIVKKSDKDSKKSTKKMVKKKGLPTIAILHTGGTIASKVDYRTGGVVSAFDPAELVEMFPELRDIANIESELVSQMWSDDLRFTHISLLAKSIKKWAGKVDGIIVGIGTDNLAVVSAGLSFIVESSSIPIIIVGSQRSSDRGSSDAGMNLICAARFIADSKFAGVALCMHEKSSDTSCNILSATKTMKLHSSRRDAFTSVNTGIIARVNYESGKITFVDKSYSRKSDLVIKDNMEDKVGLLKIHINMFPEQFSFFKGYKGLIIEGTGLGHMPGQVPNKLADIHKKIYPAIKKLIDSGTIIVMTTQCVFGGVNMNVYDKGRDLLQLGVVSGKDMLANTALVKLSWLLGNYPAKEVSELMGKNLRGEINERLTYEEELL
tara:strand:+ start:2462 stop:3739 length:1278 start_codon:yes stop_codon:yes gene_type:complete